MAAFLFLLIVRPSWPASVLVWGALAGMSNGGALMYAPSMMADIIDTDELESGLRREGSFMGVNSFVMKCATSLGALWVGPGLTLVGYNGQASTQSDRTLLMMRLMYVLPALIYLCVIAIMSRFPLTSRAMAEVRRTIDERQRSS
jgi:GPH family glycoside/pentoside/hexuronide:cation symporter